MRKLLLSVFTVLFTLQFSAALMAQGAFAQARAVAEPALEQHPDSLPLHLLLGDALLRLEVDLERAESLFSIHHWILFSPHKRSACARRAESFTGPPVRAACNMARSRRFLTTACRGSQCLAGQ